MAIGPWLIMGHVPRRWTASWKRAFVRATRASISMSWPEWMRRSTCHRASSTQGIRATPSPSSAETKWVQVVLQVRVNPQLLVVKKEGTLPGAYAKDPIPVDPHFSNTELKWLLVALPGKHLSAGDIVVSGIMLRVTENIRWRCNKISGGESMREVWMLGIIHKITRMTRI